jgi:hypothetical protein
MSYHYTYAYEPKPYYARRRAYTLASGEVADTLTTRYTWQRAMRPCEGPRGGKAYRPFYRNVYYFAGRFYKACNLEVKPGEYVNSLAPITGTISEIPTSNRHTKKNAAIPEAVIYCEDGAPVRVTIDGETYEVHGYDWPMMAEMLGLETCEALAA